MIPLVPRCSVRMLQAPPPIEPGRPEPRIHDYTRPGTTTLVMDVPFGLADTVNPMRASSVRHFFGTLPNGGTAVLGDSGLNLFVMGVRGGAQARAAGNASQANHCPERVEQERRGRERSFWSGVGRHSSAGSIDPARISLLSGLPDRSLRTLSGKQRGV